jgi:hypothetical protein
VPQVAAGVFQPAEAALIPVPFLDLVQAAQIHQRLSARLFVLHPGLDIGFRLKLYMQAKFFG